MNPTEIQIQRYNGAKDNIGEPVTIDKIIETIAHRKLFPFINNIRRNAALVDDWKKKLADETDVDAIGEIKANIKKFQTTVDDLKKSLPAVTWSGTFNKRAAKELKQYSGLICIDIDKVENIGELKAFLKDDPFTWLLFTSPSGNGLKVVVRVDGGPDAHLSNFLELENYYAVKYGVDIDQSGKDVSRLCFLSMDDDFRCNYDSDVFKADIAPQPPVPAKPLPELKPLNKTEQKAFGDNADSLEWVKQFTDKKMTYAEGNRNNYIFLFACNANRKGFSEGDTVDFLMSYASELPAKEIEASVQSAFRNHMAEHGKYKFIPKLKADNNGRTGDKASKGAANRSDSNSQRRAAAPGYPSNNSAIDQSDFPVFWKEHSYEKGKGDKKYTVKRLELWRVAFKQFLQQQGFFIMETGREGYQICHRHNGVIRPVDPRKIKNHVYGWCKSQDDRELFTQVEEMLLKGQKNYFAYTELDSLPVAVPDFLRDTKEAAYFYFQNCYVKITADEITTHQMSEITQAIWDTSIIKKDFTLLRMDFESMMTKEGYFDFEKIPADIIKFVAQVATNPNKYNEVSSEVVIARFQSICSSIGYMLHGWKNPIGKAVIAVDHKIPADKSEQNGGTGKSIIGRSFKYLKGTTEIDGRDFDERYPFRFESIDLDTKIVTMADCKASLDFGSFFNPITSDFRFNRRHTGFITLAYEDSPKWWFDSNFILKGDGASHRRRQHVIEFDDFYSDAYNPLDYFGHLLFTDWDNTQWNLFYNFYFSCVQLFLEKGLVPYPQSNYDSRRLLVESNQEFIDYLDGQDDKGQYRIGRNKWLEKKVLLKMWNDEASSLNMSRITPHLFSKQVKKYCTAKGYVFYSRKSNSVEYYMIADKTTDPNKVEVKAPELDFSATAGGWDRFNDK